MRRSPLISILCHSSIVSCVRATANVVKVHHHFRDAAFGGRYPARVGSQPELLAKGRLHALAGEYFPFDFGSLQGLVADQLDPEAVLVVNASGCEWPFEVLPPLSISS
jgi:hypothetical protein